MKIGVSTSSLFTRKFTEDALGFLADNDVDTAEIFLASYCEYNKNFGEILKGRKGGTDINSVHTLTTQFEPQLYSVNERAAADSFKILNGVMEAARCVGAKYYTFHGVSLLKKTPPKYDYGRIAAVTDRINAVCAASGVGLSYENVHWCYYSRPGFFKELKSRCPYLNGVLDIKQAEQSGYPYEDYIDDMAGSIVTVHLSDRDENGKLCLPCTGAFDYLKLFRRLKDAGFDGAALIEAYPENYGDEKELLVSVEKLKEIAYKIF